MSGKTTNYWLWLLLLSVTGLAQQISYKGRDYPATPEWSFHVSQYLYDSSLSVQIGKNDTGALLQLRIESSHPQHYIGGTVYLFLEDNTIITCTDKQMRESKGNLITSWYVLTADEIKILSKKKITDIRFAIMGESASFSSRTAHFKAINRRNFLKFHRDDVADHNETAIDVSTLYN